MLDNYSKYIYEVYRQNSVSAAADKLFLSQPALSASIKKAETELGFEIFNRKSLPFTLTPRGKMYIDAIEKVIRIEKETQTRIKDLGESENKILRIALSSHMAKNAIPKIYTAFSQTYPDTDISIEVCATAELPLMLKKGLADVAFTSVFLDKSEFETIPIFTENYIVAISREAKIADELIPYSMTRNEIIERSYTEEKIISDVSVFHNTEFVYAPPNTNIYKKRKIILGDASIFTHATTSTLDFHLSYNLSKENLGAFFATDAILATLSPADNFIYFVISDKGTYQTFNAVYLHEERPASRTARLFAKEAQKLFENRNPLIILSC